MSSGQMVPLQRVVWDVGAGPRVRSTPPAVPLTLREAQRVVRRMARAAERPTVVLAGVDPLAPSDRGIPLPGLVEALTAHGFPTGLALHPLASCTTRSLRAWAALGVQHIALHVDTALDSQLPGIPGVRHTDGATLVYARAVVAAGMRLYATTRVTALTAPDLMGIGALLPSLQVSRWDVSFVVPTAAVPRSEPLRAVRLERVLAWLDRYAASAPFPVTTEGAPHFIRHQHPQPDVRTLAPMVRDAQGMLYITAGGEVWPGPDLPLSAGNVRQHAPQALYRSAPLFKNLRNAAQLGGRCGWCAWSQVCGGSRARAYALTGDALAQDPHCVPVIVPVAPGHRASSQTPP